MVVNRHVAAQENTARHWKEKFTAHIHMIAIASAFILTLAIFAFIGIYLGC